MGLQHSKQIINRVMECLRVINSLLLRYVYIYIYIYILYLNHEVEYEHVEVYHDVVHICFGGEP